MLTLKTGPVNKQDLIIPDEILENKRSFLNCFRHIQYDMMENH